MTLPKSETHKPILNCCAKDKIGKGKVSAGQEERPALGREWQCSQGKAPGQEELALDSYFVLCSSKHGIEPGAVVGQKDRWGVKLHHLQRKETSSACDSGTLRVIQRNPLLRKGGKPKRPLRTESG